MVLRLRPALLAAALLLLLVPAAPAGAAEVRKGPAGAAFYKPPKPLPGSRHGDLVWTRPLPASNQTRLAGGANALVLYRTTGVDGDPAAVSGSVAIPRGKAPKGGFPVVSWAHGTTGIADQCAPTRQARDSDSYHRQLRAQLEGYLRAGYAVAQTDYEGLGTPGTHPYLVGRSEGRSVLDIVRAARRLDARVGKRVALMGHSQGGHAVLWAASLTRGYTPELRVRGTVAYAPASHVKDQAGLLDVLKEPTPLSALISLIFRGAEIGEPSLKVLPLLSDKVTGLYPRVEERCLGELAERDSWGGVAPAEILREGADRAPLLAAADRNDPENLKIRVPLLIAQGTKDTTVLPGFTDALDVELRDGGATVRYEKYDGVDHTGIPEAGRRKARAYLKQRVGR